MEKAYQLIKHKLNFDNRVEIDNWIKLGKQNIRLLNKILTLHRGALTVGSKNKILSTVGILKSVNQKI